MRLPSVAFPQNPTQNIAYGAHALQERGSANYGAGSVGQNSGAGPVVAMTVVVGVLAAAGGVGFAVWKGGKKVLGCCLSSLERRRMQNVESGNNADLADIPLAANPQRRLPAIPEDVHLV